jgi:hypothetical protein
MNKVARRSLIVAIRVAQFEDAKRTLYLGPESILFAILIHAVPGGSLGVRRRYWDLNDRKNIWPDCEGVYCNTKPKGLAI